MRITLYRYKKNNQIVFDMLSSMIEKYGFKNKQLLKIKIKNMSFLAPISIQEKGSHKYGRITIPKNVVDYLKLRPREKINITFEIK